MRGRERRGGDASALKKAVVVAALPIKRGKTKSEEKSLE